VTLSRALIVLHLRYLFKTGVTFLLPSLGPKVI
jgi:hypothetical protein